MSSQFFKKAIPIPSNYIPFSTTKSSKTNPSLFFISNNSPIGKITNKFGHPNSNPISIIPLFAHSGLISNSTRPEFPKKPHYDPSSVPQEMPEIPRKPEIETSPPPGYIPPEVPEMPWPTPTPRPPPTEIPMPHPDMPSTPPPNNPPTGPKLPPDPDILPPTDPPQIDPPPGIEPPLPHTPPDIREPPGPGPYVY